MIIDGRLLREECDIVDDVECIKKFKCVITKEEFLECYNAWVKPADTTEPKVDTHLEYWTPIENTNALQELPQYHFDRDEFVSTFEQVFRSDEILELEVMCQQKTALKEFLLFYHPDWEEFYIIHLPSGTIVNWYKHLGRTNTCNRKNFSIADLKHFLERLKADMRKKND